MLLIEKEMPVSGVASTLKIYAQRIWGVFNYWVERAHKKDVPENLTQIEDVCIDMSPSFIAGCTEYLRESQITFDKFHVVKEVNKAMDKLRKIERKGNELLKGYKYTFLKKKLSDKLQTERDILLEMYPKLGQGYWLKEMVFHTEPKKGSRFVQILPHQNRERNHHHGPENQRDGAGSSLLLLNIMPKNTSI